MEHPDDQLVEDAEDQAVNTLQGFILKQQERALEREHDLENFDDFDEALLAENSETVENNTAEEPSSSGKYVPPSKKEGAKASTGTSNNNSDREAENTLRVSNLTKAVTEDDLRELFCRYGRISRISLPKLERKDERGNIYKEPKGFAYIAFMSRADAEVAMEALQGHGYDHLILKIEWAKAPDASQVKESGLGRGYTSGYGEKLAQDTKEKVSFASNLTENR